MMSAIAYRIMEYVCVFIALIVLLPIHEFAHAFIAVKCGDGTPKLLGRYTLNPLKHFDIIGLIFFLFAGFGWAKPVPVNPNNFKHYKRDTVFVAVAGVIANYILSFFSYGLYLLVYFYMPEIPYLKTFISGIFWYIYRLGLVFFVFNLIPFFPLDGFRIIDAFSKKRSELYWFFRKYGIFVLYALILLGFIANVTGLYQINFLGIGMNYAVKYVGYPITAFWGWIF